MFFREGCRCTACVAGDVKRRAAKRDYDAVPEHHAAKLAHDRKWVAAKRAAMTPELRAAARKDQDRIYRERHHDERRAYYIKRRTVTP